MAEQHIQWMHDYGLSCVIYDWYWTAIDGKPVGFVFLPECLEQYSRSFGKDSGQLLQIARDMAKQRGLPGIYFVGCARALNKQVQGLLPSKGYDAISAYNYHAGDSGKDENRPFATSYEASPHRGVADHMVDWVHALLIPAKDPPALAVALVKLLREPWLREKMAAANSKKPQDFRPQTLGRKYIQIFKEILEDGRSTSRVPVAV